MIAEVEIAARRLRRGRSATSFAVEATSQGQVGAQANLVFAHSRDSTVDHDFLPCPDVPEPQDCPAFAEPSPLRPAFVDNFDTRRAGGTTPMSQADTPTIPRRPTSGFCSNRPAPSPGTATPTRT
ncbi:hypothetical protein GORHZ_070_00170 [Gordonia rhizosphera NBRC 16068]|uniref:Uncharacterized protein n=1 Tax=Gordonia rhizosphera NBRC 16068 TaxID=1108045 RepID=K6WC32_9ACTN|nr:acyl-CoA thioesterase domain-containing protein [Gordonia rhizosphera]GAB89762.1 hypothetical protein GORHZ_070_00170 [Gordonia rhizosphera NBRC 16068]